MPIPMSLFCLALTVATHQAFAQTAPADLKAVKFTGEVVSKSPYKVKFKAPAGHHFNKDAPPKVELLNAGSPQPQSGKIEKSEQTMTVDFPKEAKIGASDCAVKANLFVCNDANTYCLPIRQEFDCKDLKPKS